MDPKFLTSEYSTEYEIELGKQGLCTYQTEYGCRMGHIEYCKQQADPDSYYGYCRDHDNQIREDYPDKCPH